MAANNTKGEMKEVLGAVTGDRRVEAEGRVEQQAADPQAAVEDVNDDTVDQEIHDVRTDHHDLPDGGAERDGPLGTT